MKWKALGIAVLAAWVKAVAAPNIIFIMADDLGYGGLSCYGNKVIRTPHLDALAGSGVKCTDFHSNGAVCSPTRAALMTGRYQQRSGIEGVITAAGHREVGLALEEKTMAEAMKKLGYATALFGKWHLGYEARFGPVKQGFDEFRGFVSGNVDYHTHIDQEGFFDWWQQDQKKDEKGYLTDLITEDALDFIERKKDGPFFVVLHHGAPHYPLQDRETPGFRKVRNGEGRRAPQPKVDREAVYVKMVEIMDEGVGRIVAQLEELKLRENTLIVFCSDNGPAMSVSPSGLRGRKRPVVRRWSSGARHLQLARRSSEGSGVPHSGNDDGSHANFPGDGRRHGGVGAPIRRARCHCDPQGGGDRARATLLALQRRGRGEGWRMEAYPPGREEGASL